MSAIGGYFALMRPVNMAICGLSVAAAGLLAGKPFDRAAEIITGLFNGELPSLFAPVPVAAFSAAIILAAGNVLNDVFDSETDRINAPDRPIPSGRVSKYGAALFSAFLFFSGISLAFTAGSLMAGVAVTAAGVLVLYDAKLKSSPIAGNIAVALLGGLAFVYGGIAGGCAFRALLPGVFASLLHFGREIIKDAEDIAGDRSAGITTAATLWGVSVSSRIAAAALTLLVPLTILPAVNAGFGSKYIIILFLGVWPSLVFSISLAFITPSHRHFAVSSRLLKLAMPAGILAVLVGFQGW